MNRKMMLSAAAAMSAFAAFAASTVSDVVARQRWPWSETVDIDYTLTGDKGDVTFSATWDGQSTPVIIGTDFQVEAGQHRFEWCPTNNYAGQTLTGFTVTAEAGSTADHKYLILDLVNGGYTFMAAPPDGGWTDEYKSTKMVFARCPAGTYRTGLTGTYSQTTCSGDMAYVAAGDEDFSYLYGYPARSRSVTLTSDWYMGIYVMTDAQYNQIKNGSATSDYKRKMVSYNECRGMTNDSPNINWPVSKYAVTIGSIVDILRKKSNNTLCIDLPQEEQWEVAARAGTTTFWPNGGTQSDSIEQLTNYVNQICNWYYSTGNTTAQEVGLMQDNGWGIYDIIGNACSSWTLDTAPRVIAYVPSTGKVTDRGYPSTTPAGGTDPIGFTFANQPSNNGHLFPIKRVVHSMSGMTATAKLYNLLPSIRYLYDPAYNQTAARFAIHLKPLNFPD